MLPAWAWLAPPEAVAGVIRYDSDFQRYCPYILGVGGA